MEPDISSPRISANDAALTESLRLLSEIQAAIQSRDTKAVQQKGDLLKGAITSVLAKAAFEAVSRLENTRDEGELADALEACRRLQAAILSFDAPSAF